MVSNRGKRKIQFGGKIFYWFLRKNTEGKLRIHILSEDKKLNLEYPPFDTEVPVTPKEIRRILSKYYSEERKEDGR